MKEENMNSRKDMKESTRARRLVRAKGKQCYLNAFRLIQEDDEYGNADYIEGMAVFAGALVIEHGWVEKDGVIVDPTLPTEELAYFPGLRFRGRRGLAEAVRIPKPERTVEDLPIFYRFGWGGIESPEFRAAMAGAYRYAGMGDLAKRYEEWESVSVGA
jgi:hypothetical protein